MVNDSLCWGDGEAPYLIRPKEPDCSLVLKALSEVGSRLHLDALPTWRIDGRIDRPRSTIFRILTEHQYGSTIMYYKVAYLPKMARPDPIQVGWSLPTLHASLAAEERLSTVIAEVIGDKRAVIDEALAVNPEYLSAIRLAVPGTAFGRSTLRILRNGPRSTLDTFHRIGQLSSVFEAVGRRAAGWRDTTDFVRSAERRCDRSRRHIDRSQYHAIAALMEELLAAVDLNAAVTWAHGDLSPTNILLHGTQIGIIDFSWREQIAGESIANFLARVVSETGAPRWWRRSVTRAVLAGYGVDEDDPAWRLARLLRALRNLQKPNRRVQRLALEELRSLLD